MVVDELVDVHSSLGNCTMEKRDNSSKIQMLLLKYFFNKIIISKPTNLFASKVIISVNMHSLASLYI